MLIEVPVKARISVFDMVPIISLPTRIPDKNSSRLSSPGARRAISWIEELTDMDTSMMAPSAEIRIPAYSSSPIFTSVIWATYSNCSISDTL